MQQGHQGAGVGLLRVEGVGVTHHDHAVVLADVETVEHRPGGGVGVTELHGDVAQPGAAQRDLVAGGGMLRHRDDRRARLQVLIELPGDSHRAFVPPQDQHFLRVPGQGARGVDGRLLRGHGAGLGHCKDGVVGGEGDHLVVGAEHGVACRIQSGPGGGADPDHGAVLVGEAGVGKGLAGQRRVGAEVDLVAPEVEQVGVHDRDPRLARGLHQQPGDGLAFVQQHGLGAADDSGRLQVGGLLDLGHQVHRLGGALRVLGEGEHRLDHVGVGLVLLLGEHDDRPGLLRTHQVEVAEIGAHPAAAHHPHSPQVADLGADGVLHLHLVPVGHHHHHRVLLRLLGLGQLGEDGEHRLRPPQDQGVALLDHQRAALAQLLEPGVEGGGDHPDQGAGDEQAADGDPHHGDEEPHLAPVVGEGAAVEGVHQAVEHGATQTGTAPVVTLGSETGSHHNGAEEDHQHRGGHPKPGHQGRGALGHGVVEGVAKALAEGDVACHW